MVVRFASAAACAVLIAGMMLGSPTVAATTTGAAVTACSVTTATSPLSDQEATVVFGQYGEPPIDAPNGDLYFAPTRTTGGIEELNRSGRVVWQYVVSGPFFGWASTGDVLVAIESTGNTLLTVNMRTHAVKTMTLPALNTYKLAASISDIVVIGTNGQNDPSGAKGVAYVLDAAGRLLKHWYLPSSGVEGAVWAATYGDKAYIAAQIINSTAQGAQGGNPTITDVVYEVSGSGIAEYEVPLPLDESGFQLVATNHALFYSQEPSTQDRITDVKLSNPAKVNWRTIGPVGGSIVTYGNTGYVTGVFYPGNPNLPTWALNLATGKKTGATFRDSNAGVYPELAGPWGVIALVQPSSGNPSVAVFSGSGRLLSGEHANTARSHSETSTQAFVVTAPTRVGSRQFFLSSALPRGAALKLPAKCS